MRTNTTFNKAQALLCHPAALAAMALLLLNDLIFKRLSPSWMTGKISDFAVLFFLPFLAAMLLAWLLPSRLRAHERLAFGLAFAGTGLVFAAAKTFSPVNTALTDWAASLGMPLQLVLDPSDLLALFALAAAWTLYQKNGASNIRPVRSLRWTIFLPLAALLVLGDAAAPDVGVYCAGIYQGQVFAQTGYVRRMAFTSQDGGLTWYAAATGPADGTSICEGHTLSLADPRGAVRYRFTPGVSIERSQDGGKTWQVDYPLRLPTESQRAYTEKLSPPNAMLQNGPLNGIQDPATGNLIFAMGHEGVLVRQANGTYTWVAVNEYHHDETGQIPPAGYFTLLAGELFLGFSVLFLAFTTLTLKIKRSWWRILLVVIGWIGWLICALILPPALSNGPYMPGFSGLGSAAVWLWGLIAAIVALVMVARTAPRQLWSLAGYALLAALLFPVPYLLWALNFLPGYYFAALFAILLVAGCTALGLVKVRAPEKKAQPAAAI